MNPMKQESIDLELRIKRYEISKFYYLTLVRDQMDHVNKQKQDEQRCQEVREYSYEYTRSRI